MARRWLLLHGGVVYPMESGLGPVEAIAVRDGRVAGLGPPRRLVKELGRRHDAVDLRGARVSPGLEDSHVHVLEDSLRRRQVDLAGAASQSEALRIVRAAAAALSPGEWLRGGGWDANAWGGLPRREVLDQAVPRNPAALWSHDGHALWCNTAGLRAAGLDAGVPSPEGGVVVRDESGRPTGVLLERATRLVTAAIPPRGREEVVEAVDRAGSGPASVPRPSRRPTPWDWSASTTWRTARRWPSSRSWTGGAS